MDKKKISPFIKWCIGKCHNFLQNSQMVPKVYASSPSYFHLWDTKLFPFLCPNWGFEGFKICTFELLQSLWYSKVMAKHHWQMKNLYQTHNHLISPVHEYLQIQFDIGKNIK